MSQSAPTLKRERDPSSPPDNEPVTKKPRLDKVFILMRTDFLDDYKTGGDDWAEPEILGVYETRVGAERAKEADQYRYVESQLEERHGYEMVAEYFYPVKSGESPRVRRGKVMRDLDSLLSDFTEGEFINNKIEWDIVGCVVQPDPPPSPISISDDEDVQDKEDDAKDE